MPGASFAIGQFLGGEISQFSLGRFDRPDYRYSLKVCLNGFPIEIGTWVRRPGTLFAHTTRGGKPGRVVDFDFEQTTPVTMEFTDGWVRFRNGAALLTTNDAQTVTSISSATPAVLQTAAATDWNSGDTLIFSIPSAPLLENREFVATVIDSSHMSLADSVTGAGIDGSTIGTLAAGTTVSRVQELATSYVSNTWSTLRAVQAENISILLNAAIAPQALTVEEEPTLQTNAAFALNPANFLDGPYLDPFANGAFATPSAKSGIINLTLSFAPWKSSIAYSDGSFVTKDGVNYVSLKDQNANKDPATNSDYWAATSSSAAINDGRGFLGSDIGRLVRLFSEPAAWDNGAVYTTASVVTYNPSGIPGGATYWQSLVNDNTDNAPGTDLTNWKIVPQGAAIWSWGKIVDLTTIIDRAMPGSFSIGNMSDGGGITAPFNGNFSQIGAVSAKLNTSGGAVPAGTEIDISGFVGKSYLLATPQQIQSATIYPASDDGFSLGFYSSATGPSHDMKPQFRLALRASNTPPSGPADGKLLGTTGLIAYGSGAQSIISSDQVTAWKYVWIEVFAYGIVSDPATSYTMSIYIGQVSYFSAGGTGDGNGYVVEILGPPLLYTNTITTWRMGLYSQTTGWPTCGCYDDGRLWLGGAVGNRFDASVSGGIDGAKINFAPTDQYGVVAASNAISETLRSESINPIYAMMADLQGVIMLTKGGNFLVLAPTAGSISPLNITSRRLPMAGAQNVEPRRTDHTMVFVQRFGKKLLEGFADVFSGKFTAPNLADKAEHIAGVGIAELAYQAAVTPIIWGRGADGSLFGITYKRDTLTTSQGPTFAAWHRHSLGSGRVVESICGGPSENGDLDTLTMVTNDPATGIRHVEILTDTMSELTPLADSWFVDDSVSPSSTSTTNDASDGAPLGGLTINGLWHLNGKTVTVSAAGLDCGDFVVASGSVFVPYGDGISGGTGGGLFTAAFVEGINPDQIAVGFTYTSQGQITRPFSQADSGARNGPSFGKLSRMHRYAAQVVNTLGISFGGDFSKTMPANFRKDDGTALDPLTSFTGVHQDSLEDDYNYSSSLCWQITRPYPANIVAIGPNLATQDQ